MAPARRFRGAAHESVSTLEVDGIRLTVRLQRKRVTRVNATLRGSELRISAPPHMPQAELDRHVLELARRLLRRVRARALSSSTECLDLARRVAARFPVPPEVRELRFSTTQRARWGSYSLRTGVVRIHAALRLMPRWVLESVVAHELAHAVHPDHGPAFWRLLHGVCPEAERARAFLAGVSWLAGSWESLPPVERAQLGIRAPETTGRPEGPGGGE